MICCLGSGRSEANWSEQTLADTIQFVETHNQLAFTSAEEELTLLGMLNNTLHFALKD